MISWVLRAGYIGIIHRRLIPATLSTRQPGGPWDSQVSQFGAIMAAAVFRLDMLQTSLLLRCFQLGIYAASALYVRALCRTSLLVEGIQTARRLNDLGKSLFLTAAI